MKRVSIAYKLVLYTFIIIALYTEIFAAGSIRLGAFVYFTIQSNMIAGFCLFLSVVFPENFKVKSTLKGISLFAIIITGIIYNFVLYKIYKDWGTIGYSFSRTVLHVVSPIGYIIDWLLFDEHGYMKWRYILLWFAYPIVYCVASIFAVSMMNFSIYSFFSISNGYLPLVKWLSIFLGIFIIIGLLIVSLDKTLKSISNNRRLF